MTVGGDGWSCSALVETSYDTEAYYKWCGGKSFEQCSNCISRRVSVGCSAGIMKLIGGTVLFLDREEGGE